MFVNCSQDNATFSKLEVTYVKDLATFLHPHMNKTS